MFIVLKNKVCEDINKHIFGMIEGLSLEKKIEWYPHFFELYAGVDKKELNWGMVCAAQGGHLDLVKFFVKKGADNWNWGINNAARRGLDLVKFFISRGADWWNLGMESAIFGGHLNLVKFFVERALIIIGG